MKVQVTENGKTWFLPADYTQEEAEWEIAMQTKLNAMNRLLGEPDTTFEIIETN
jgi:hypothetical protein